MTSCGGCSRLRIADYNWMQTCNLGFRRDACVGRMLQAVGDMGNLDL